MKFSSFIGIVAVIFASGTLFADNRPAELWRDYMHGIVPDKATKIPAEDIVKLNPQAAKLLSRQDLLKGEPSFKIKKDSKLTVTLPVKIADMKGNKIRLFYWCKAFKAGYNNGWHAPWLVLIARNAAKKNLFTFPAWFHTIGTYPWHCYYVDIFIPQAAEEFAVNFYTPNGIAWFSGFAWEKVTQENTYSNNYKQCPTTGSLAPNVYYDQMPEHMTRGYGTKYPFRWFLGSKIGLIGQPDDITTLQGFTNYFKTKGIKKSEHLNHGLLHLADAYRLGKRMNLLPPVEDGWLENFCKLLLEAQDPATGFWHDGKSLSMGATFHILNMHFRYHELKRSDRPDIIKPGMDIGTKTVPRADEMIRQTLKQQSTWRDQQGNLRRAGWNAAAYTFTNTPDKGTSKFTQSSTWDAIYLLRLAGRHAKKDETRKEIYNAIKDAYFYFVSKMILPDGNIRMTDTSNNPSLAYVGVLFQDFHCFERRIMKDLPQSSGTLKINGKTVEISAQIPANMDAARIYIAPANIPVDKLDECYLAGIIHRKGKEFSELDPLALYQKCNEGIRKRYGRPFYTGKGARDSYLNFKIPKLKFPLPFTENNTPLTLSRDLKNQKVYISSSDYYGEESPLQEIKF